MNLVRQHRTVELKGKSTEARLIKLDSSILSFSTFTLTLKVLIPLSATQISFNESLMLKSASEPVSITSSLS